MCQQPRAWCRPVASVLASAHNCRATLEALGAKNAAGETRVPCARGWLVRAGGTAAARAALSRLAFNLDGLLAAGEHAAAAHSLGALAEALDLFVAVLLAPSQSQPAAAAAAAGCQGVGEARLAVPPVASSDVRRCLLLVSGALLQPPLANVRTSAC